MKKPKNNTFWHRLKPDQHLQKRRFLFPVKSLLTAMIVATTVGISSANAADDPKAMKTPADPKEMSMPAAVEKTPAEVLGGRVTGLLQVEFSDKYLTPRGLEAHTNSGVVQPMIILFWDLWNKDKDSMAKGKDGWLDDVTLVTGEWNEIDFVGTPTNRGANGANYDEVDPFGGLSIKFLKDWQFDATTTLFAGQNGISQGDVNEELKMTYHDHFFKDICPSFTINPYVSYWKTLNQYSPTVFGQGHSGYGVIGMDPKYDFSCIPLTLELPTNINICSDDFYRHPNGDNGSAGVALLSLELKASTPLSFIPISYGAWKVYAGLQYYSIFNTALIDTNAAINGGAGASKDSSLYQLHAGLTCFF